jgi:hypothetical protein
MARNPKPKQDNPEQSKWFIETAQALDADDSAAAFERAFAKVISATLDWRKLDRNIYRRAVSQATN